MFSFPIMKSSLCFTNTLFYLVLLCFASYIIGVLQPISTNQHTVKDSFSFADWAKVYKQRNGIMCSLDVCSLFTNVPLDETIDICLDKLF